MDVENYYALLNADNEHLHKPRTAVVPAPASKRVLPEVPSTEGIDFTIPPEFLCPISNKIMRDPVTNCVGNTYERYYLENWLRSYGQTDPKTGAALKHKTLWPHTKLQAMIRELNIFNLEETLKAPALQIKAMVKPTPVVTNGLVELVEQLRTGTPATRRFAAETIATALQRSVSDRNTFREIQGLEVLVAIIRSTKAFTGYHPASKPVPPKGIGVGFAATSIPATIGLSPTRSVTRPVHIETNGELSETKRYALKALSLAVCNNAVNQEYVRMIDGIFPVLALLRDCPNGSGAGVKKVLDPNRYTNMAAVSSVRAATEKLVPVPPATTNSSLKELKESLSVADPGDMDVETRRYCILTLCNMAQNENNHDLIGKGFGNGMRYFVQCIAVSKTDVETKRYGMKAIAYLTKNHPFNQALTLSAHGVSSILALLYSLPQAVVDGLEYPVSMHYNMSLKCKDTETRRFACLGLASLCAHNSVISTYMSDHYGIEVLLSVCEEYTRVPGFKPSEWIHFHTVPGCPNNAGAVGIADGAGVCVKGIRGESVASNTSAWRLPQLPGTQQRPGTADSSSTLTPAASASTQPLDALTLRYATKALAVLSTHAPIHTQLVSKYSAGCESDQDNVVYATAARPEAQAGGFDVLLRVLMVTQDSETKLNVLSFIANVVSNHLENQEKFRRWQLSDGHMPIVPVKQHQWQGLNAVSGCPAIALLVSMYVDIALSDSCYSDIMRVTTKAVVHLIKNNNLRMKYALREEKIAQYLINLTQRRDTDEETVELCHMALDLLQTNSVQEAQYIDFSVLDRERDKAWMQVEDIRDRDRAEAVIAAAERSRLENSRQDDDDIEEI